MIYIIILLPKYLDNAYLNHFSQKNNLSFTVILTKNV